MCNAEKLVQNILNLHKDLARIDIALVASLDKFLFAIEGYLTDQYQFLLLHSGPDGTRSFLLSQAHGLILFLIHEKNENDLTIEQTEMKLTQDIRERLVAFFTSTAKVTTITFVYLKRSIGTNLLQRGFIVRVVNHYVSAGKCENLCHKATQFSCTNNECHMKAKTRLEKYLNDFSSAALKSNFLNESSSDDFVPLAKYTLEKIEQMTTNHQWLIRHTTLTSTFLVEAVALVRMKASNSDLGIHENVITTDKFDHGAQTTASNVPHAPTYVPQQPQSVSWQDKLPSPDTAKKHV